jgi:hypothetical protein
MIIEQWMLQRKFQNEFNDNGKQGVEWVLKRSLKQNCEWDLEKKSKWCFRWGLEQGPSWSLEQGSQTKS